MISVQLMFQANRAADRTILLMLSFSLLDLMEELSK